MLSNLVELVTNKFLSIKPFLSHNLWAGMGVFAKALLQLIILKIAAVFFGQSALGMLGQSLSCLIMIQSFSNGGLLNYLVINLGKASRLESRKEILGICTFWMLLNQIVFFVPLYFFSSYFSNLVFGEPNFGWFFTVLSLSLWIFSLNPFSSGVLSSEKNVKAIFILHFSNLLTSGLLFYLFAKTSKIGCMLWGALFITAMPGLIGLVILLYKGSFSLSNLKPKFSTPQFKGLLQLSSVSFVTGGFSALLQVLLRSQLVSLSGFTWSTVGEWQSIIKISEITASFLGVSLLTSFLPQISAAGTHEEAKQIAISQGIKYSALIIGTCAILALIAPFLLTTLYTKEYEGLATLLRIQLFGDMFRFSTWIFSYFMLARLPLRIFLSLELIFPAIAYVLGLALSQALGLKGLIYAQVTTSIISFGISLLVFKFFKRSNV